MPARRKSRQKAIQVLFLWDSRGISVDEAVQSFYESLYSTEKEEESGVELEPPLAPDEFMEVLARGCANEIEVIDALITKSASNWRLDRMPVVDRNVLRMAVYEMRTLGTAPAIVIDEALEIARRYSEEEAIPFINGVLDAVRKAILPNNTLPQPAE